MVHGRHSIIACLHPYHVAKFQIETREHSSTAKTSFGGHGLLSFPLGLDSFRILAKMDPPSLPLYQSLFLFLFLFP